MQLGFVIDHSRCIGCHACTVACKSENDVPLGSFRTWVKYTETGAFPQVKRHFAVLRCNQCSAAPCVTICPTIALSKHANGIVDVDPKLCIGCKSCMQGCPYDALYIHPESGTAQKCHFCEHRAERGLAPACAVVCPTEAIIPGDFDDPLSLVSRLKAKGELSARKTEAGTRPNVLYKEVDASGIDPRATNAAGGYLWANQQPGAQLEAERVLASAEIKARTVYDVDQQPMWGWKVSTYLFTKSISAGAFLAALPFVLRAQDARVAALASALALVFLLVTTALLVVDLKRPERFLLILAHPNWNSWLVKGAWILMGYGACVSAWLALALFGRLPSGPLAYGFGALTALLAAFAAGYTAFLFGQAKGRVLWLQRGLFAHLLFQAVAAGAAALLVCAPLLGLGEPSTRPLALVLAAALFGHLGQLLTKRSRAPAGREREYAEVVRVLEADPYAQAHKRFGLALGIALPWLLLALGAFAWPALAPACFALAGLAALVGLFVEEDLFVKAGQALPIS